MRNIKAVFFLLVSSLACSLGVFGYTVDDVIERARNGSEYQRLKNSLDSAVLSLRRSVMKDADRYKGGVDGTFADFANADRMSWQLIPYFSYTSRDDNTISVTASAPIRSPSGDSGDRTYGSKVEFEKKILIDGVKDNGDELLERKVELEIYLEEKKMELKFRQNVINLIKAVISSEIQRIQSESNLEELREAFDNDVRTGVIEAGGTTYAIRRAALITAEKAVKLAFITADRARDNFRSGTGFELGDVAEMDVLAVDKVGFVIMEGGNTAVVIDGISAEMDELNYRVYKNNGKNAITIGANAEVGFTKEGYEGFGAGLSASYGGDFVEGKLSASVAKEKDAEAIPQISFGLSFFNDPNRNITKNEEKRLVAQMHQSRLLALNSFSEYLRNAMAMAERMNSFDLMVSEATSALERERLIFEMDGELHDGGYLTDREFRASEDAYRISLLDYRSAMMDLILMNIEAEELMI